MDGFGDIAVVGADFVKQPICSGQVILGARWPTGRVVSRSSVTATRRTRLAAVLTSRRSAWPMVWSSVLARRVYDQVAALGQSGDYEITGRPRNIEHQHNERWRSSVEYVILRSVRRPREDRLFRATADRMGVTVERDNLSARLLEVVRRDRSVVGIAPNIHVELIRPHAESRLDARDEELAPAWGLDAISCTSDSLDGAGTTVAVLDTGIDSNHYYFSGVNMCTMNFSADADAYDGNGHGTHCAGTIFGQDVGAGRMSVAPRINLALMGKVLTDSGEGTFESVLSGVFWSLKEGADVISLSLGPDFPGLAESLQDNGMPPKAAISEAISGYTQTIMLWSHVVEMAQSAGALVIVAGGNESARDVDRSYSVGASPLASTAFTVGVGAALLSPDRTYRVAPFSNHNVDLCGPGVGIVGPSSGGTICEMSGTSMATPFVAGAALLWRQHIRERRSQFRASEWRARLIGQSQYMSQLAADPRGDPGAGMVQVPKL